MSSKEISKLKSQKLTARLLIIVPIMLFFSYLANIDFNTYGINNYLILAALSVLIIIGLIALRNTNLKEKNQNS
jgi:hypothetical protein